MKLKDLLYLSGFRPKVHQYGFETVEINLPADGKIMVAQWLHPKAGKAELQQAEIDFLRQFLKPGDTAIDIGAYTGDTAIPLALAVGITGHVLALEPNKYVFPVLKKNAEWLTGKGNIIPLPFAATPTDCFMEFEYSDPGFCNGGFHEGINKWKHWHVYKLNVEGRNLVKYLKENYSHLLSSVRYIKVDAEGFDCTVLESISEIICRQKPTIRVEVFKHSDIHYRKRLYQFLKNYQYHIYYFGGPPDYIGQLISPDELMKWKHYDMLAVQEQIKEVF